MNRTSEQTPNYEAIKAKQQVTWSTGHYSRIGSLLQITGEQLVTAMDALPGASFLDVAAGNGNLTMAAARRFCAVTSTDYVESSLKDGAARAEANGLDVRFQVADAEALPFADASFQHVGSTFGVMFTPDQERAAGELLRVCRPGGSIGMANWTPEGFLGDLFRTIGRFVPPPGGLRPPVRWGTEEFLQENFEEASTGISVQRRDYDFRYTSSAHFLEFFKDYYGPTIKALEALDDDGKAELEQAILDLLDSHNTATDGTLRVPSEYLEIVITRR